MQRLLFTTAGLLASCGPSIEPTEVGEVGAIADYRSRLPEWATDQPVSFEHDMTDNAKSQAFDAGGGGEIRLTVWSAADGNPMTILDHPQWVAGFGVEVQKNPNGANVSWRIIDDQHLDQALVFEVKSQWVEGLSTHEWLYVGRIGAETKWRFKESDSVLP